MLWFVVKLNCARGRTDPERPVAEPLLLRNYFRFWT
jgi:hypothetical protein